MNTIDTTVKEPMLEAHPASQTNIEFAENFDSSCRPAIWPSASLSVPSGPWHIIFSKRPTFGEIIPNDDLANVLLSGGKDILKKLGPISREEYAHYERL